MGIPSLIPNLAAPQVFEPSSNPFQTEGVLFQNTLLGLKGLNGEEGSNPFPGLDFGINDSENLLTQKKNSDKELDLLNVLSLPTVFTADAQIPVSEEPKTLNLVEKSALNNLFLRNTAVEPQQKPNAEKVKGSEFPNYDVNAFSFESLEASKEFDSSSALQTWSVFQTPQSSSLSKEKGIENYNQVAQTEKTQGELSRVNAVSESNNKFLGNDSAQGESNTHSLSDKKLSKEMVTSKESIKQEGIGEVVFENKPNWFQNKEVTQTPSDSGSIAPFKTSEVATKVQTLAAEGGGKMQMFLTPPHLGQVEIQVLTKGKKVELGIRLEDAASKSMVEQGLHDLKQALESQNLQLSKVEISEGEVAKGSNLSQGLNFSEHESSGQSSFFQGNESPRRNVLGAGLDRNRSSEEVVRSSYASAPSTGRLNLKV